MALAKGDALSAPERQKIIDEYARYTGLDRGSVDNANLRIDVLQFTKNLLLDQKLRVGRLDGRFMGPHPTASRQCVLMIRPDRHSSALHCGLQ